MITIEEIEQIIRKHVYSDPIFGLQGVENAAIQIGFRVAEETIGEVD